MSAWPARLRDLRDCKSARLRHSSRPPTLAATPRLRCINICRTPVVDWIGFQRLIPNPVRTAVRRNTRPQTVPSRERRNTKVLRLSPISRTVGHTSIPVFSSARIRFRCSISGSVHGNRRFGRRTQSVSIRERRNPNAFGIQSIRNTADCAAMQGSNPISMSDSRISPRKQAVRQRTQTAPIRKRRNTKVL